MKNTISKKIFKYYELYLLFIPVAIFYIIFSYGPMFGLVIAFKNFNFQSGIFGSPWVGMKHFIEVFSNSDFLNSLVNTLLISLYRLIAGFPAPIILAILLNELRSNKFKKFVQTVSYMPHFISWVIIGGMVMNLLSPNRGPVNMLIKALGGEAIFFMNEPGFFKGILVITSIWKETGWGAIIFLAAIAGIDPSYNEAAIIDGANRFKLIWHVTLPSIRNVIVIMLILNMGNILNAGFEQVFVLINPAVSTAGEIIDYYVYRQGLVRFGNYSYAAAVGLFKSVVCLILVLITDKVSKLIDENGGIM